MLGSAMIGGHPRPIRFVLGLAFAALTTGDLLSGPASAQDRPTDYDSAFTAYRWADPILEWPLKKVCDQIPGLNGLDPATTQSPLPEILRRVGANVQTFRATFVNTTSVENVEESRSKRDGSPENRVHREQFRYLMLAAQAGGDRLTEYRTDFAGHEQGPREPKPGFVKTSGFASMPLLLGPDHQSAYDFKYLGTESTDGRKAEVIEFAGHPVPDAISGQYLLFGKPVPIIMQGVAWIDAVNFQVLRMHTDLLAPLEFAGLTRLSTDAVFREISFPKGTSLCWLPEVVDVTADFYGRTYHNRHTYSDYQLFLVESRGGVPEPTGDAEPRSP